MKNYSMKNCYPETFYNIIGGITETKIKNYIVSKSPITCQVIRLNTQMDCFEVDIGGGLHGLIPTNEMSIYKIFLSKNCLSPHGIALINKVIRAIPISFINNQIILSRKAHMQRALEMKLKFPNALEKSCITGFSKNSAFVDMGAGIIGRSSNDSWSPVFFKEAKDLGFDVGDVVWFKKIFFDEENKWFDLSRLDCLPSHHIVFKKDDIVCAKVFTQHISPKIYPQNTAYWVLIDRCYCGLMNTRKEVNLSYGDCVIARISQTPFEDKSGPQLRYMYKL